MSQQQQQGQGEPIDRLRKACLARGVNGIRGIGRMFRLYDDDGSKRLTFQEFRNGVSDYGVQMSESDLRLCFTNMDTSGDGSVDYEEFLSRLRGPMSQARCKLIDAAFNKLDKTGDGKITVEDLQGTYNVNHHPKFKSGEWTKKQVLEEFLKNFQVGGVMDEKVTREEFKNYYAGVSASIDKDVYFDYMMRNNWKL